MCQGAATVVGVGWVYDMKTPNDLGGLVRSAVVRFLDGAPAAMRKLAAATLDP